MRRRSALPGIFLVVCRLLLSQTADPGAQPKATPQDLIDGQRDFAAQCSYCHGPQGEGGQGAVLATPRLPHAADDETLFHVIREGIPGTTMPASALSTDRIWRVAAFVRSLGRVEGAKSAGDSARGLQIYTSRGRCAQCHTVRGHGGAIGPDLTNVGTRLNTPTLRNAILYPESSFPRDFMQVTIVAKDSRKITGVRVNEDTFSIQLRDLSSQLHSFWKSELTEVTKDFGRSPMPAFKASLTPADLEDLVAYLESLKGD
jgi:cytochrome c oxidase cbb3-type subunit 3